MYQRANDGWTMLMSVNLSFSHGTATQHQVDRKTKEKNIPKIDYILLTNFYKLQCDYMYRKKEYLGPIYEIMQQSELWYVVRYWLIICNRVNERLYILLTQNRLQRVI